MTLPEAQTVYHPMTLLVKNEVEWKQKEPVTAEFEIISYNLPGGTEKK